MSEEPKTKLETSDVSEPDKISDEVSGNDADVDTKITNEKELSREQKTAVKKLKDYSREAKKRAKQDYGDEKKNNDDNEEEKTNTEAKTSEKSEISFNTYLTVVGVLTAIAGLYYTYKTYAIEESKEPKNEEDITKKKTIVVEKTKPKFRTL